jgi:organic radical activating enzyme
MSTIAAMAAIVRGGIIMLSLPVLRQEAMAIVNRLRQSSSRARAKPSSGEPRPGPYTTRDGKIYSDAIELQVTRHCNLTCRACTHLSPINKPHFLDPQQADQDLRILARHFRAGYVRLLGGEPFLHPRLIELLQIARASGVAERVRIVTNGVLLPRQSDDFWRHVDEVLISVYPGEELSEEEMRRCQKLAQRHRVKLEVNHYDRFRESYSEIGTTDQALIRRIFHTCHVAHVWRCHTVDGGYFYKCPQSLLMPEKLETQMGVADRVMLDDSPDLGARLREFLESPEPLTACANCLGSAGRLFDHEQTARKQWRDAQQRSTEQMFDEDYLKLLEREMPAAPVLCVREEVENPHNRELVHRRNLASAARL